VNDESNTEHNNGIKDPECPEQQDVRPAANAPGLVRLTWKSSRQPDKVFVTVNTVETQRTKGVKKMYDRLRQWFTSFM
jgi:hypothetical protein